MLITASLRHMILAVWFFSLLIVSMYFCSVIRTHTHTHTHPLLFSSQYGPYITRRPLRRHIHTPKFMCSLALSLSLFLSLSHTHTYRSSWGARWRVTWNAHNGSGGINFSHFICLLLHEEQLGWRRNNKQDIVVWGFLLWFQMPPADPYIKLTVPAVKYTVHCSPLIYSIMSLLKIRSVLKMVGDTGRVL